MSTVPLEAASNTFLIKSPTDGPLGDRDLLFEYHGADLILHSRDSYHFRVPKSYIVNSSSVLGEIIQRTLDLPDVAHNETSLPVVELPESGAILHSLLTFIFPVTPLVPRTAEETMELLSVAQKYQMDSVLVHIRGSTSTVGLNPPPIQSKTAFYAYSLAQKYGLRPEALQAARTTLKYPMSIEDLEDKLDIMPGASLYELWKYHERVRVILAADLADFRTSDARDTLTGLHCEKPSASPIPGWIDEYIESVGGAPNLFDLTEFNAALARHLWDTRSNGCTCALITSQAIRNFWAALTSVVHNSFEEAESALCLVQERLGCQTPINLTMLRPEPFHVPDANLIIRSSDRVVFRLHKPVLAMASPFFKDLLSLPQPPDGESVDGLPVVDLPEDAELLGSFVSMLYPVRPVIPNSYDKVLYLLAACQKYDMTAAQTSIRAEVDRGCFPGPIGADVFGAFGIASSKGLIPEMEKTARKTLDYPMTFETLGEGLRLFEDRALRDLASFRKRCRDNLVTCLKSFLEVQAPGPSSIWVGCPEVMPRRTSWEAPSPSVLPSWLSQLILRINDNLKVQVYSHPLTIHSSIREEYSTALQNHSGCTFCLGVHVTKGLTFCSELEKQLALARDKTQISEARDKGRVASRKKGKKNGP